MPARRRHKPWKRKHVHTPVPPAVMSERAYVASMLRGESVSLLHALLAYRFTQIASQNNHRNQRR